MRILTAACALLLLGCGLSDAARPFGQPLQLLSDDGAGVQHRQLQALKKTQATCILKVVADLVGEIKSLDLGSEVDDAVREVDLAKFLVSSLAGLGVSNSAINSVLVGGKIGKLTSQGALADRVIKSVVQALQTILDQGIGLPLDDATLKKAVNVDRADRVLVRLVATTINDYVKLANALSATANSTGSKASAQAAATTNSLVGKVTNLLG